METYERIRELRKKHLKMSQTEFGERLGVSRSVINNIELNALARPEQKLSLYKLICSEFGISEDWLLNGIPPMEASKTFSLDDFAHNHGATELELEILKAYFEIEPALRNELIEHFKKRLTTSHSETVEEAEAAYIKSRSNYARSMDSSASNIIGNTITNYDIKKHA